jgi:hypothetical protein
MRRTRGWLRVLLFLALGVWGAWQELPFAAILGFGFLVTDLVRGRERELPPWRMD